MEREQHRPFLRGTPPAIAASPFCVGSSNGGALRQRGCVSPSSEQLDLHDLACFDDVGLRRDLDVAVGLRHAGDVARRLERRHRRAVRDPHRVELVPAGRRDDAPRERQRARCAACTRAAAPCGAAAARAACRRSTGTTSGSRACRAPALPPIRPKTVGLPGFTAMPWKITSPDLLQRVHDQVALADRAAAREHDDVGSPRPIRSRAASSGEVVRRRRRRAPATPPCSPTIAASVNRLMS